MDGDAGKVLVEEPQYTIRGNAAQRQGSSHDCWWRNSFRREEGISASMSNGPEAMLALADGRIFRGRAFGAIGETVGEVVFNTAMTGYQEVLTDPSYKGQLVCMTYPEIGNVGINAEDAESRRVYVEGFIVKEYWERPSNWRSEMSIGKYLEDAGVVGIEGIDTRALVRHLRTRGAQEAVISSVNLDADSLVRKAKASAGLVGRDLVKE